MNPDEVERRIENVRRAFENETGEPEGLSKDCALCKTFEATRRETIENEATGQKKTVALCPDCWDKTDRYSRGEDVDFGPELRLTENGGGGNAE